MKNEQTIMNTNLHAVYYGCREFGKVMLAQGKGSIINTASMSGVISNTPQPQAAYNASKAAVIMLTKSLAGEWADRGVRVNCISPGYVNTPMTQGGMANKEWYDRWMQFTPLGRVGEPQEIAPAVLFLARIEQLFHREQSCRGWGLLLLVKADASRRVGV